LNRRPRAYHARALPTELTGLNRYFSRDALWNATAKHRVTDSVEVLK
jgi:hypothetical protein